jgi:hypothetical protein
MLHCIYVLIIQIFFYSTESKKHSKKRKREARDGSDSESDSDVEDELMEDIVKLTSKGKIQMELLNDKVRFYFKLVSIKINSISDFSHSNEF